MSPARKGCGFGRVGGGCSVPGNGLSYSGAYIFILPTGILEGFLGRFWESNFGAVQVFTGRKR